MKVRLICAKKIHNPTIIKVWLRQLACFFVFAVVIFSPSVASALNVTIPAAGPNYIDTDGDWMVWLSQPGTHAYQFSSGTDQVFPEFGMNTPSTSKGFIVYPTYDGGYDGGPIIVRSLSTETSWTVGHGMQPDIDWPLVAWVDYPTGIRVHNMMTSQEVLIPDTRCGNVSISGNWLVWEHYEDEADGQFHEEVWSYNLLSKVMAKVGIGSCPTVDGNWAVWRSSDPTNVTITAGNLVTGELRSVRIAEGVDNPQWPVISGSKVLYWGDRLSDSGSRGVFVYDIETKQLQAIASGGSWATIEGNQVAYSTGSTIRVVDMTDIAPADHFPIAFTGRVNTSSGLATPILLSATDAGGHTLSYKILTAPSHGSLSPISKNSIVYTAEPGYTGIDRFSFVANDGINDSAAASVLINVGETGTPVETPIPSGATTTVTAGQVSISFDSVTEAGTLEVARFGPRHEGPANFRLIPDLYFDIHPTATFAGAATVTIAIPASYTGDITKLKVFHWKDNGWETIEPEVNTVTRTATFTTTSFSDYAFAEPAKEAPVSVPASSAWSIGLVVICMLALIRLNKIPIKK